MVAGSQSNQVCADCVDLSAQKTRQDRKPELLVLIQSEPKMLQEAEFFHESLRQETALFQLGHGEWAHRIGRSNMLDSGLSARSFDLVVASAVNRQQHDRDRSGSTKRDDLAMGATIRAHQ
ncbi:hypothetical protein [Bradyrhizobium cenepequi]